MTVDGLRRYFRNLSEILKEGGDANKSFLGDLEAIERGLSPFADMPLKTFAEFLAKAQTFDPNAVMEKKPTRASTPRAPKVTLDIGGIAATVKHIYDTASQPDVTIEAIDENLKILDSLTVANLTIVAAAIKADSGLKGKKKPQVLAIIKHAVRDMWGSARRIKQ